jgi:flagellar export protein FliJ
MKRFRFPLERVLRLRELHERDQARVLGEALHAEREQRAALERAHAGLERAGEQVVRGSGVDLTAGALRNLGLTLQAAMLAAEAAADAHRAATESVVREQDRFKEARRDRRVIEKLREKRHMDWSVTSARAEQKENDSLTEARRHIARGDA